MTNLKIKYALIFLLMITSFFINEEGVASKKKKATEEQVRFFENKIRPLLSEHCNDCHGEDEQESDLRLDSLQGMLKGGKAGPALIPGKPKSSLLITAITHQDADLKMPPEDKMTKQQIDILTQWVKEGAPHPDSHKVKISKKSPSIDYKKAKKHWAYQSLLKQAVPKAQPANWIKNPIDAFVLKQLNTKKLTPVKPADKRTLIRRATFDLIGLPPTPEETDQFLKDNSPDAFAKVVNRLLASPHYGERWGRHWLDIARYADSNGLDENVAHGNAWRYRDYVVNSFNIDKPYDHFLKEQIAGDLLPDGKNLDIRNEHFIATGFLSMGPKVLAEVDKAKMEMDIIDEQIDTVCRSLLAVTMGCARCHDHKFDPFEQSDYYAMAGIFKSTRTMESFKTVARWNENPISAPELVEQVKNLDKKAKALEAEVKKLTASATAELKKKLKKGEKLPAKHESKYPEETKKQLKALRDQIASLKKNVPVLETAMSVKEGETKDIPIHIRGSHLILGKTVSRGVPVFLASHFKKEFPAKQSGRLEFAHWITDPQNPLTYRVMVNRVWRWHFGEGIVKTTDNFGMQGEKPSNQPLLDWLTMHFLKNGNSIKDLHRIIMLSNTYQMSSDFNSHNAKIDLANQFLWRRSLHRIEAEALRDSMLAISGSLDMKMGGNLLTTKNRAFVFNHESKESTNYKTNRRSIYLPVIRNHIYSVFQLFDYSNASMINGNRESSTVSTQALFLLNSPFVNQVTTELAENILAKKMSNPERLQHLYQKCYGRNPSDSELKQAILFIKQFSESPENNAQQKDKNLKAWQVFCQAIISSNEFIYLR